MSVSENAPAPKPALALFQPDIPQNLGTLLRFCACLDIEAHVIEPCGFLFDDKRMHRAGMDYMAHSRLIRHSGWTKFQEMQNRQNRRAVLLTTHGSVNYTDFEFKNSDILIAGSESKGAPDYVHEAVSARIRVPMKQGLRSLNIATACAMILGEALRQTDNFPKGA